MNFNYPKTANLMFTIHNISGVILFAIGFALVLNQYFRSSIRCFGDEDVPQEFAEEYCIGETFLFVGSLRKRVGTEIPFPGIDKSTPGQVYKYQKRYRWIPFSFLLQSFGFLIIYFIWIKLTGQKISAIVCGDDLSISRKRLHQSFGKNWFFALQYLQANVLLIVNAFIQISCLNIYLENRFSSMTEDHNEFSLAEINFPKVASCSFYKYGRSGNVEPHNLICVLPLNELFVKVYSFDYYLLATLRVLTIINFIYYCILSVPIMPTLFFNFLVSPEYQSKTLYRLSQDCFIGDWLVITLVMQNMDPVSFREIIENKKSKETFTDDLSFMSPTHSPMQIVELLSRNNTGSHFVVNILLPQVTIMIAFAALTIFSTFAYSSPLCFQSLGFANCKNYSHVSVNGTKASLPFNAPFRSINSNFYCACDPLCYFFNDCCIDAAKGESIKRSSVRPQCKTIETRSHERFLRHNLFVIERCPKNWENKAIKESCERNNEHRIYPYEVLSEDYYFNSLMVFSNETKIFYPNIFCSICNDDFDQLISFGLSIECNNKTEERERILMEIDFNFLKNNATLLSTGSLIFTHKNQHYDCSFVRKQLETFLKTTVAENKRPCIQSISNCPKEWQIESIRQKCLEYTNYTFAVNGPIYKNEFCAKCNNEQRQLTCQLPSSSFASIQLNHTSELMIHNLDFKNRNLLRTQQADCLISEGKVYNPLLKKCIYFGCFRNFERDLNIGKCVPKKSFSKTYSKKDCKTITVHLDSVMFVNLTTIYIKDILKHYNEDEFEIDRSTESVKVCHNDEFHSIPFEESRLISSLSTSCTLLSVICLVVHIAINCRLQKLKKITIKLQTSIDLNHKMTCVLNGLVMHFFYLSSFFWMNVFAFDIYNAFRKASENSELSSIFMKYSTYGWITPLLIVIAALFTEYLLPANDFQPWYSFQQCWISGRKALLIFFIIPFMITSLINLTFIILSLKHVIANKKAEDDIQQKQNNYRLNLYIKLALIVGLTWTFHFIANFNGKTWMWYPFIILNALQGIFVLYAFTIKHEIKRSLKQIIDSKKKKRSSLEIMSTPL
ncbi:uncharacterized protein B4U79_02927 [Dinothrombium tinctorium]|uniref:Innexin n=1 Tax=Dinothrombium tinctorium TaxID=1965070 RepID=A0A443RFX2_9ACAR|nr:uncharacterized protein B4U79_02927 [Dinothrombium tinctorium]